MSQTLKTAKIDTSKTIRQISMKSWNGFAIVGIRLIDSDGNFLVDLDWSGVGNWLTHDIPDGQEIIGFECNTKKHPQAIPRIRVQLWTPHFNDENEYKCRPKFGKLGWYS